MSVIFTVHSISVVIGLFPASWKRRLHCYFKVQRGLKQEVNFAFFGFLRISALSSHIFLESPLKQYLGQVTVKSLPLKSKANGIIICVLAAPLSTEILFWRFTKGSLSEQSVRGLTQICLLPGGGFYSSCCVCVCVSWLYLSASWFHWNPSCNKGRKIFHLNLVKKLQNMFYTLLFTCRVSVIYSCKRGSAITITMC